MRKISIYMLFLFMGGYAGYWLVRLVKSKIDLPNPESILAHLISVLLLSAVIGLAIWAGSLVAEGKPAKEEEKRKTEEPDKPKTAEEPPDKTEPSGEPRGTAKKIGIRSETAWLIPKSDEPETGFPISKDTVYVGRSPTNDILLNDESVSRKHANITRVGGVYTIFDLNSKNGTYANGQRIQKHVLKNNDIITIGNLSFIFKAPEEAIEVMDEALPEIVHDEVEILRDSGEFYEDSPTRTRRAPVLDAPAAGTRKSPPIDKSPTGTRKAPPIDDSPTGTRKYPDGKPKA